MNFVKGFAYFVLLKVTFEALFRSGISLIAAAVIAVAMVGIDQFFIQRAGAEYGRILARRRLGQSEQHGFGSTIIQNLSANIVASTISAIAIVFAFSRELWQREFHRPFMSIDRFWSASFRVLLIVAVITIAFYVLLWATSRKVPR